MPLQNITVTLVFCVFSFHAVTWRYAAIQCRVLPIVTKLEVLPVKAKITERTLTRKEPGEIWDTYLPGFGLRIGKTKRTFFVMTRINGKQRRLTVGNATIMKLGEARDKARELVRDAAKGIDPDEAARTAKREAVRTSWMYLVRTVSKNLS